MDQDYTYQSSWVSSCNNQDASSYLSEGSIVIMAWKKIIISNGQNKGEKLTPEEFNKLVKCLEPLKDEFDFEFNTNVKFNTTEL